MRERVLSEIEAREAPHTKIIGGNINTFSGICRDFYDDISAKKIKKEEFTRK
jgi:hypothetical protein